EEETVGLAAGHPIPALEALRAAPSPVEAVAALATAMLRNAHGLEAPPVTEAAWVDLRAHEAVATLVRELRAWAALDGQPATEELLAALERAAVRPPGGGDAGRVAVLDLMRARTRR